MNPEMSSDLVEAGLWLRPLHQPRTNSRERASDMNDTRDWSEQVADYMMERNPSLTRELLDNMTNAVLALCDGHNTVKVTPGEWLALFDCPAGVDGKALFGPLLGAMERATIHEAGETSWRVVHGIIKVPAHGIDEQGTWAKVYINPSLSDPDLSGR